MVLQLNVMNDETLDDRGIAPGQDVDFAYRAARASVPGKAGRGI